LDGFLSPAHEANLAGTEADEILTAEFTPSRLRADRHHPPPPAGRTVIVWLPGAKFQAITAGTPCVNDVEEIPDRLDPALVTIVAAQGEKAEYFA
jgi:hypothetical protein